jgi:hypothetical protein
LKASRGNLATFSPEAASARISLGVWVVNFMAVVVPFLGLIAVAISLWGQGFSWAYLGLFLGMYALTALAPEEVADETRHKEEIERLIAG